MEIKVIFVLMDIKRTNEGKCCICKDSKPTLIEYLRETSPVYKSNMEFIYNVFNVIEEAAINN